MTAPRNPRRFLRPAPAFARSILASGCALFAATQGIAAPVLPVFPAAVFRVTGFGAVGDGVTDNTNAIQNAINAAQNAGGGTVEVPAAGASYLSGPITIS